MFIYLFLVQDELETSLIILPMRLCDTGDLILIKIKELTPPDDIFRSKGLKKKIIFLFTNMDELNSLTIRLLQVRNQMKIYHWQTKSYARHKATDSFLQKFEPLVDRLVEAIQGGLDIRIQFDSDTCVGVNNCSEDGAEKLLKGFRNELTKMISLKLFAHPEFAQIRDDMLEVVDVTLYLFTLK